MRESTQRTSFIISLIGEEDTRRACRGGRWPLYLEIIGSLTYLNGDRHRPVRNGEIKVRDVLCRAQRCGWGGLT